MVSDVGGMCVGVGMVVFVAEIIAVGVHAFKIHAIIKAKPIFLVFVDKRISPDFGF